MVTVNVHALLLPWLSVAVLVTTVTPTGKVLPLGGMLTTVGDSQLSVAVTEKVTLLRLHRPALAAKTRLLEQTMTGAVVSTTVTCWLHCALFWQGSFVCHVRVAMNAHAPV